VPLIAKRGRREDQHAFAVTARAERHDRQGSLDRLAQSHGVGYEHDARVTIA
jgi:hypothetical protein